MMKKILFVICVLCIISGAVYSAPIVYDGKTPDDNRGQRVGFPADFLSIILNAKILSAQNVISDAATTRLKVTEFENSDSADVYFEYGEDTTYANQTSTQTITDTGEITKSLSGLYHSTTYIYRAIAEANGYKKITDSKTFTTSSGTIASVAYTDYKLYINEQWESVENSILNYGEITKTGGYDCTEKGFVYDTQSWSDPGNISPSSSNYSDSVYETGTFGRGSYEMYIEDVTLGTTYYIRAYVKNPKGYEYSDEISVTPS